MRQTSGVRGLLIPLQPVISIPDLLAKLLMERNLAIRMLPRQHILTDLLQDRDHLFPTPVLVVAGPRRLNPVIPVLLQLDGSASQFRRYRFDLLGQLGMGLLDALDYLEGGGDALLDLTFGCEVEGEKNGLRMLLAEAFEYLLDDTDELGLLGTVVQLGYHLRDDIDPPLSRNTLASFQESRLDAWVVAVTAQH